MLDVNVMIVELAVVARVQVQKYKRHSRAICSGECGMVKLIECLQDGGEEVEDGEGGGDRHLPVEEGQVILHKLTKPNFT